MSSIYFFQIYQIVIEAIELPYSGGKKMNSSAKELQSDFISVYERLSRSRPIYVIACSIAVPIILSCLILNPNTIKINGFISYSAMMSIPRIFSHQSIVTNASLYFLSIMFPSLYLNLKGSLSEFHKGNYQIKKDIILNGNQAGYISIGMSFDLIRIQNFVLDNLLNINVPLLILYGQDDQIVNQQDSITLYCKVGNLDKTIKILKEQYHLFLLDSNKQEVIDLISQWIDIQVKHNYQKEQQEIINFTQNLIPENNIKQEFATKIREESKRKTHTECHSGILSFCSNKSEESFAYNHSQQDLEEFGEESESESIKDMLIYQKKENNRQKLYSDYSASSLKSTNSQNLSSRDTKQNENQNINVNEQFSPFKKLMRRKQNIQKCCNQPKHCDHQNDCLKLFHSKSFDPKYEISKKQQNCSHHQKHLKYNYLSGTQFLSKNKIKFFAKLIFYGLIFLLIKILHKKWMETIKEFIKKYSRQFVHKLPKMQKIIK